jgi:spore maturation protein CgeB
LLYLQQHQINFCKQNFPDYKDHEALIHIDKGIAPQFKSRIIEAAFCKTLNLIKYDEWNVIEKWFEPNKEFIYYYDKKDLEEKIKDILENYDKYSIIIENAHKKVFKYFLVLILII